MADDGNLRDLLRSPASPGRPAHRRSPRDKKGRANAALFLIGGFVIGALVVFGGYVLAAGDGEPKAAIPTTTIAAPAPTVATIAPSVATIFPSGYTDLNGRVAIRAERVLMRPDEATVALSMAVRDGLDPNTTTGFFSGQWELELSDGTRVEMDGEFFDPLARGSTSVRFPLDGIDAEPVSLHLVAEGVRNSTSFGTELTTDGLPLPGPVTETFALDTGVEFIVDGFELRPEGGRIEWHIDGGRAAVTPTIQVHTSRASFAIVVPLRLFSTAVSIFGTTIPAANPVTGGVIEIEPPPVSDPAAVERVEIDWAVNWFSYLPASVEVDLSATPVVVVSG